MFPTGSAFHGLLRSFTWRGTSSVSLNKIMQETGPVECQVLSVSTGEIPPTSGGSDTRQCSPQNDLTPVASMSTQHNERPGVTPWEADRERRRTSKTPRLPRLPDSRQETSSTSSKPKQDMLCNSSGPIKQPINLINCSSFKLINHKLGREKLFRD